MSARNPWFDRRSLNFAHQGGAREAPSNTLFAYRTALEKGADALEMDVHATADRRLIVLHDPSIDRTTNGSGSVDELTLEEIKSLDAAYWWVPGHVTTRDEADERYLFRGVAKGRRDPPVGYSDSDFKVPTLREVLEAFPGVYLNLDIKQSAPEAEPYEKELAELLAEFGRGDDVIVGSFIDSALASFRLLAPDVATSASPSEVASFWGSDADEIASGPTLPFVALQVPMEYGGITVVDEALVEKARAASIAVHVWTIDEESEMQQLLDLGVHGIMTDRPSLLEEVLDRRVKA